MKKMINIYVSVLAMMLTLIACNDGFLEKTPQDKINDASYWKTSADVEMYANQFYPLLKDPNYIWKLICDDKKNKDSRRNAYQNSKLGFFLFNGYREYCSHNTYGNTDIFIFYKHG